MGFLSLPLQILLYHNDTVQEMIMDMQLKVVYLSAIYHN